MTVEEVMEKIRIFESGSKKSTNMQVGTAGQIISDYLTRDCEICPSMNMLGFCLDDDEAFAECITSCNSEKLYGRLLSISSYVVNKFGYDSDSEKRYSFYDGFDWDRDPISIKAFYGTNMAACTERACFVHNVLKILGYDAELVIGYLSIEMIREGHCYNLLTTPKGAHVLFDVSCWVLLFRFEDNNSTKMYPHPVIAKLSDHEYSSLLNGNGYTLNSKSLLFPRNFVVLKDEKRIYC